MAQIVGYPGGFGAGDTNARVNTTGTPPVPLGTVGYDAAGKEYRYIRAGGTINATNLVIPASTATPFDAAVVSSGANQQVLGVAEAGFVANDCGWVLRNGPVVIAGGTLTAGTNKTTAAAGAAGDSAAADTNDTIGIMVLASPATIFLKGL